MTMVEELRERGITLEADGDRLKLRGPADLLTLELRAELAGHKAEILAHLRRQEQTLLRAEPHSAEAGTLEPRIRFARSAVELDQVVEEIQGGFEAVAERLAALTMDTARQLAQGLINMPAGVTWEAQA